MRKFLELLRYLFPKYTWRIVLNFACVFVSIVFSLFSFTMVVPVLGILFDAQPMVDTPAPWGLSVEAVTTNFNYYLSQVIRESGRMQGLWTVAAALTFTTLMKTGFAYAARYLMAGVRTGVVRDLRDDVFGKMVRLDTEFFAGGRKGDIMSRLTNDVNEVEVLVVQSLEIAFREPMTIIVYLAAMIYISPMLSAFMLLLLPVAVLVIGRVGKSLRRRSTVAQDQLGSLLSIMEETLGGMRVIKVFNAQEKTKERFFSQNFTYTRINKRIWRRRDLATPLSEFLGTVMVVVVMWYGGRLIFSGQGDLTAQQFIGYLVIFSQIISPAKAFSTAFYNIQKGLASADRIDFIANAQSKITNVANPTPLPEFTDRIEYRDVSFAYAETPVLRNVNLVIPKGKTVALVGQSGSGKSTLVDLLPRLYDVGQGQICVDGIDIRQINTHELRGKMGIVNQDPILFNDTIFNNIAFGCSGATLEQVEAAAKVANAHEFIMETPDGYQTLIGDRGGKLSGGQRQRLSIARAVLANPPILILDEATSALDTESERLVQEALTRVMRNRTSIIVAHRLSTIVHADLICVMQEGQIVESGTHAELLALNGVYRKLHDLQVFA